ITPGIAQRMTAGTGILHSERNDVWRHDPAIARHDDPAHVVQMWIVPDTAGVAPGYAEADVTAALATGELVPIVSGLPHHRGSAVLTLQNRFAGFSVARLPAAGAVHLPDSAYLHVFVARGSVSLEGTPLGQGDAARLTADGGLRIQAAEDSEILVWEMTRELI
ncbi:MAG: pirin family protein, partial [Propionibacteriaceae bacterium]|nr:pirin family protein [Propionibacteriaceae bacterium]